MSANSFSAQDRQRAGEDAGPIEADRPGFAFNTNVLHSGVLQFETGFTIVSETADGIRTRAVTFPSPLVRLGIGNRMELGFGGEGMRSESAQAFGTSESVFGLSDFSLGMKLNLFEESGARPSFTVFPLLSVPAGPQRLSSSSYDPSLGLGFSKGLPHGFDTAASLAFTSTEGSSGRITQRTCALGAGHELFAGWKGFWEAYKVALPAEEGGSTWTLDTGVVRTLGDNVQVDVSVGRNVRSAARGWFFGFGFAFRRGSHAMPQ